MNRLGKLIWFVLLFVWHKSVKKSDRYIDVIYSAVEDLGGVYVKLMQFLSLRSDLIPYSAKLRFLSFYDRVPIEKMNVREELLKELGEKRYVQLEDIEDVPFASGTFGQVYKAKLIDGAVVVVKVKRHGLTWSLSGDLFLIRVLGWVYNMFFYERWIDVPQLVGEFTRLTWRELDYKQEVQNAKYFYEQYKSHPVLFIPRTYAELSTSNIIVQEYVDGIAATDLLRMRMDNEDYRLWLDKEYHTDIYYVINRISYDTMWQVFNLDHFYSDHHPGNIKILPNNRYALVDFGIVGQSPKDKRNYFEILSLLTQHADDVDAQKLGKAFLRFGANYLCQCLETYDAVILEGKQSVNTEIFNRYAGLIENWRDELRRIEVEEVENFSKIWFDLFRMGERFRMRLPRGLFAVIRTSALIKSFTAFLEPNYFAMRQVYAAITRDVPVERLLNKENRTHGVSVEEAMEELSDWIGDLAETDESLYYRLNRVVH